MTKKQLLSALKEICQSKSLSDHEVRVQIEMILFIEGVK